LYVTSIVHQKHTISNQDKVCAFNIQKKELDGQLASVIYPSRVGFSTVLSDNKYSKAQNKGKDRRDLV